MDELLNSAKEFGWGLRIDENKLNLTLRKAGKMVLDVGCAAGLYCDALERLEYNVVGVDILVEILKGPPKGSRALCSALCLPFKDQAFETILLYDVAEHLYDDLQALKEAKRVMTKNILLTVPNAEDNELAKWGLTYSHFKDHTHKRVYTLQSLKDLVRMRD